MRIELDLGLCQGHSVCVSEAPDVFEIADSGEVRLLEVRPSPDRYEALVAAAQHCPNQVIKLEQS